MRHLSEYLADTEPKTVPAGVLRRLIEVYDESNRCRVYTAEWAGYVAAIGDTARAALARETPNG